MNSFAHRLVDRFLRRTGLQNWPVRVRGELATGARWTLYPASAYWRGGYEPGVTRAILSLGDLTGQVCWDLGAHYGYYSVALAMRTGPTGQVAAFEPFPANFARLERHRRMNKLDWLKVFPAAISDSPGEVEMITGGGDTENHLRYDDEVKTADTTTIRVRTVRLDDLVASGEIRPPNFIKIDVEGHGHVALAGAAATIARHRPVMLMGFHSHFEVAGTKAILDPLGYQWQPLESNAPAHCVGFDYLLRPPA